MSDDTPCVRGRRPGIQTPATPARATRAVNGSRGMDNMSFEGPQSLHGIERRPREAPTSSSPSLEVVAEQFETFQPPADDAIEHG